MSFPYSFEPLPTIVEVYEGPRPGNIIQKQQTKPHRPERLCGFKSKVLCGNKPFNINGLCELHSIENEINCNHSNCKREVYNNYLCWIHGGRKHCRERGCPYKEFSKVEHLCAKHYKIHKRMISKIQRETNPRPTRSSEVIIERKPHTCQEKGKKSNKLSKKKYKCHHCSNCYRVEWYLKIHINKYCKKKPTKPKPKTKSEPIIIIPESSSESSSSDTETESEIDGSDDESESVDHIDMEERVYTYIEVPDTDGIYFEESIGTQKEQELRSKEEEIKTMIMNNVFYKLN
jgi:hypothetical protein